MQRLFAIIIVIFTISLASTSAFAQEPLYKASSYNGVDRVSPYQVDLETLKTPLWRIFKSDVANSIERLPAIADGVTTDPELLPQKRYDDFPLKSFNFPEYPIKGMYYVQGGVVEFVKGPLKPEVLGAKRMCVGLSVELGPIRACLGFSKTRFPKMKGGGSMDISIKDATPVVADEPSAKGIEVTIRVRIK